MPLTEFQKQVLAVLVANRSEESHFAGGLILHAAEGSARFSHDFDIFHEVAEEVTRASARDVASLREAGYNVEALSKYGEWDKDALFRKAIVSRGIDRVEVDWAADSAFRFFPVEQDPQLGWRLHLFDMATNKALALSARMETRDYVDIVELHRIYPLPAIIWGACGKDPGFNPLSLLKMMRRFARIDPAKLEEIQARKLDPVKLKEAWIEMSDYADAEMTRLADDHPEIPMGVAFVDGEGKPGWIGENPALRIHSPSVRGCLPTILGI